MSAQAEKVCDLGIKDLQGAACYGDYLFQFTSQDSANGIHGVLCCNLNNSSLPFFVDLGFNQNYHNSHASFGLTYYENGDPFPLLYVSENNAKNRFFQILVYRIIPVESQFEFYLVQSLPMPNWVFDYKVSYPHAVVDRDNKCLWVEGYSYDSNNTVFASFDMPLYPDNTIKNSKIPLTYFEIPRFPDTDQSFTVCGNKIFQVIGTSNSGRLRIIDLDTHSILEDIYLPDLGLTSEPEGVFFGVKIFVYPLSMARFIKSHIKIFRVYGLL